MKPAEQLHNFHVNWWQSGFGNRLLAQPQNILFHLLVDLRDYFFDPCRMNPSIRDQPHHCLASHLPSHRIKPDRKSTRLNSSHLGISYAVFCLKKKTTTTAVPSARHG